MEMDGVVFMEMVVYMFCMKVFGWYKGYLWVVVVEYEIKYLNGY